MNPWEGTVLDYKTQKTDWNRKDRSLTKSTKNRTERNVYGIIGKRTNENGTI